MADGVMANRHVHGVRQVSKQQQREHAAPDGPRDSGMFKQ
jgi:hypothetical protein